MAIHLIGIDLPAGLVRSHPPECPLEISRERMSGGLGGIYTQREVKAGIKSEKGSEVNEEM